MEQLSSPELTRKVIRWFETKFRVTWNSQCQTILDLTRKVSEGKRSGRETFQKESNLKNKSTNFLSLTNRMVGEAGSQRQNRVFIMVDHFIEIQIVESLLVSVRKIIKISKFLATISHLGHKNPIIIYALTPQVTRKYLQEKLAQIKVLNPLPILRCLSVWNTSTS